MDDTLPDTLHRADELSEATLKRITEARKKLAASDRKLRNYARPQVSP